MKNYNKRQLAILALDSLQGLEYKHKLAIINEISPLDFFCLTLNEKQSIVQLLGEKNASTVLLALCEKYALQVVEDLEKREITAITFFDEDYPKQLKAISLFPLVLYCKGNLKLIKSEKLFAIVGSRKTLPYATALATEISSKITALGATVVSGAAPGGDKAAISGALSSGNIISVIAHGHDYIYPEASRDMVKKVEASGLVISEYPPKTQPKAWLFPIRNRIIAGLSKGVLIISGEMQSGARHTMNFALDEGREVFAFPYSVGISSGELCNDAIKNGAALCDRVEDILQFLELDESEVEQKIELDEFEQKVYNAIKDGAEDAVKITAETGLKIYELAPTLSALELKGIIVKLMGNKYKTTK